MITFSLLTPLILNLFKILALKSSPPPKWSLSKMTESSCFKISDQTLIVLSEIFCRLLNEQKVKLELFY